jgi:hypothetical protein
VRNKMESYRNENDHKLDLLRKRSNITPHDCLFRCPYLPLICRCARTLPAPSAVVVAADNDDGGRRLPTTTPVPCLSPFAAAAA